MQDKGSEAAKVLDSAAQVKKMLPTLETVARILSENPNINVALGGATQTDGKTVWLKPRECGSQSQKRSLRAMTFHECAHILYSHFEIGNGAERMNAMQKAGKAHWFLPAIFNAVEDVCVETKLGKEYPGALEVLAEMVEQTVAEVSANLAGNKDAQAGLLFYVKGAYGNRFDDYFDADVVADVTEIMGTPEFDKMHTEDAYEYAVDALAELRKRGYIDRKKEEEEPEKSGDDKRKVGKPEDDEGDKGDDEEEKVDYSDYPDEVDEDEEEDDDDYEPDDDGEGNEGDEPDVNTVATPGGEEVDEDEQERRDEITKAINAVRPDVDDDADAGEDTMSRPAPEMTKEEEQLDKMLKTDDDERTNIYANDEDEEDLEGLNIASVQVPWDVKKRGRTPENPVELLKRNAVVYGKVLNELRTIFKMNKRSAFDGNYNSGTRFNKKQVYKVAAGVDAKPFTRMRKPEKRDYAVVIAIDISGSMDEHKSGGPTRIQVAREAALVNAKMLNELGVKVKIFGYTSLMGDSEILPLQNRVRVQGLADCVSNNFIVKDFDEALTVDVEKRILSLRAMSGTPTGPAVRFAIEELIKRSESDKFFMILTDGEAGYTHDAITRDAVKRGNKVGIDTFAIGIQDDCVKHVFKNHIVINKLEELKTEMIKLFANRYGRGV